MFQMLDRMFVVDNPNNAELEMRECFPFAPRGHYGCRITVQPFSRCEFPAAKFYDRNLCSGRPTVIVFFVNGRETCRRMMPQQFLRYVKIVAYIHDNGVLTINIPFPAGPISAVSGGLGSSGVTMKADCKPLSDDSVHVGL